MPQTDCQSLPLIIQDLILDHQIRNLDATFISRAEGVFSVSRDRSFTYIVPDGNSRVDWLAAMEDKAHDPRFGFTARDGGNLSLHDRAFELIEVRHGLSVHPPGIVVAEA